VGAAGPCWRPQAAAGLHRKLIGSRAATRAPIEYKVSVHFGGAEQGDLAAIGVRNEEGIYTVMRPARLAHSVND
jgi:hypothetical protein